MEKAGTITLKVPDFLKARSESASDLMHATGIAYGTAWKFSKGEMGDKFSLRILAALCKHFDCTPGDLLEYVPDEPSPAQS